MKKNRSIKSNYILFLFIIISFTVNATIWAISGPDKAQNTQETQDSKIYKNPFHENIWGVYIQKKQPLKSFQIFAELTKTNKYAYKWLINFLHKTGNNQKLAAIYPLINSAFPELLQNDPDAGFMVAYALCTSNIAPDKNATNNNNNCTQISYNKNAADLLANLSRNFPAHQQVAAMTSTLYDLNNDPQNAILIAEKYLSMAAAKSTDFLEYFKNASRYLKVGDKKNAHKSIKKCVDLQPKFADGWILMATIDDQIGKTSHAIDACKKALEITGPNQVIEYMIVRLFFKLKGAQHLVNEFVMNKKCFEKAIELLRQKEYDKALALMDKCLAENLKNNASNTSNTNNNIGAKTINPGSTNPGNINGDNTGLIKIKLI